MKNLIELSDLELTQIEGGRIPALIVGAFELGRSIVRAGIDFVNGLCTCE